MSAPFASVLMHARTIIGEAKADVESSGVCTSFFFRDDVSCAAAKRAVSDLYRYHAEAVARAERWDPAASTASRDAAWILERLDLLVDSARYYSRIARDHPTWAAYRQKCMDDVGRLIASAANEAAAAAGEGVRGFFRHLTPGGWAAVGVGLLLVFGLPQPIRRVVRRKPA